MTRRTSLVAVAVAGALLVPAAAIGKPGGNGPVDKATGGISWTTGIGNAASAGFNAHGSSPAKGQVQATNHDGVDFHGSVDCYSNQGPDKAVFSGTIERFSGANLPGNTQGTTHFVMTVQDGGTPGSEGDRVTLQRGSTPFDCSTARTANRPVEDGNLVVHHR